MPQNVVLHDRIEKYYSILAQPASNKTASETESSMSPKRLVFTLFLGGFCTFAWQGEVLAQFSNSGSTNSSSSGGSGFGQSSFGQSSFGQSSFGQSSFGQSSFGQSGFGQGNGSSGTTFGNGGATDFVGRNTQTVQSFYEAIGRQAQQQNNQPSRPGINRSSTDQGDSEGPPVRVKLRVGDSLRPSQSRLAIQSTIAPQRISNLLVQRGLSGVAMSYDQGQVTLTGVVTSDSEKRLAQALASLEPGVRAVKNQLKIAEALQPPVPDIQ